MAGSTLVDGTQVGPLSTISEMNASQTTGPKSTTEDLLYPFIHSTFDAAEYLNATLPSLTVISNSRGNTDGGSVADVSTKTQHLLSQLNAQTSRLSQTLNQLTDEIIRSGSRLAYEVEILRGETNGFSELLLDKLQADVAKFSTADAESGTEPEHVQQLRMLTRVRGRLDAVIKVFGDAMEWPVAPSELSSSLISVTAPDVTAEEQRKREEKGKEAAQKLRDNIVSLLDNSRTAEEGIAAANERINDLRRLALVWKGTAEERYRSRFIDALAKLVDDEQKKLAKKSEGRRQTPTVVASTDRRSTEQGRTSADTSYGFMNSLRKIRGDMYVE